MNRILAAVILVCGSSPVVSGEPCEGNGPCDDHDACTSTSWCVAGSCIGVPDVICPEDANPCTYASCIPAAGCSQQPFPDGLPCDDANACSVGDVCLFGACVGSGPADCDDGNRCTDDTCVPESGCTHALNHSCDGEPLDLRHWERICLDLSVDERLTAIDVACVSDSCTFAEIDSVAEICEQLYADPAWDRCDYGQAQLVALLLNVCRGRVDDALQVRSPCEPGMRSVQAVREAADELLCDPLRGPTTCCLASCLAEAINTGRALP